MSYLSELINISISHSNVLVVTSLSKYPGLAGCLIGFITGTESAIGFLRQVRQCMRSVLCIPTFSILHCLVGTNVSMS